MIKQIESLQNPFIKEILSLSKLKDRNKNGAFLLEGIRELEKAIQNDYEIKQVIYYPKQISREEVKTLAPVDCDLIEVNSKVFSKLSYREGSRNILAIAALKQHELHQLILPENPFIVVLESVEKPGNLGAVLRTCDAAAVDALIVCDPQTDIYNPNVIRSSLGCVFTNQIAVCSSKEAISYLLAKQVAIFISYLDAAENYHLMDYSKPTAIVMGSEAFGLSEAWLKASQNRIKIPMRGVADSMNVSNAAAILIYEVLRQRGF